MKLNTTPRMPTGQSPHFIVSGQEKTQSGDEHRIIGDENETAVTQKKKKRSERCDLRAGSRGATCSI